jgi:putative NADPH-quinone reductase
MTRRIAVIQGHPDASQSHYGHALASAYENAAKAAGHDVKRIDVARMDLAPLRSKADWDSESGNHAVREAQEIVQWAEHLVFFYPLWLGSMPALLKAFFEQVFRPGFAVARDPSERLWHRRLKGRSARIVVTMGMPALVFRAYFLSHSLKTLERNILGFCGIGPVRASLIGMVESPNPRGREKWLARISRLGGKGT